jgi:hypothetical protein
MLEAGLLFTVLYLATSGVPGLTLVAGSIVFVLVTRLGRYAVILHQNLYPVRYIQYLLPGAALYIAALVASWWKSTHGSVVWKGREYAAKRL